MSRTRRLRFLTMQLIGWPLLSVLVNSGRWAFWTDLMGATAAQVAGRTGLWAAIGIGLSAVLWLPWVRFAANAPITGRRMVGVVLAFAAAGLAFAALTLVTDWPLPDPPADRPGRPMWARAVTPALAMFTWAAIHLVLDTVDRLGAEQTRAARAETLAAESRLAMLRYELNPHFLFNALNSVIGVIGEDPRRAQQMVRQLSGLLRHTLSGPDRSTLGAELHTAELYLAIEQVRFEERLQVEVDVPEDLRGWAVPPMLLQPLVENAVKHGMDAGRLVVRIAAEVCDGWLEVTVSNDGQLAPATGGVGLRNLRDRLSHAHPDASLALAQDADRVVATVRLP